MTRWVRSGSTQKHKKMPGDATQWGEFDNQNGNNKLPKKVKIKEVNKNSKPDSVNQINLLEQKADESYEKKSKKMKIDSFKETDSLELKQENMFLLGDINASSDKTCSLSKSFFDQDCSVKKRKKGKHLKLMSTETESKKKIINDEGLDTSAYQNETSFVVEPDNQVNQLNNEPIKKSKKKKKKKALNQYSQEAESRNFNFNAEALETSLPENKTSFLEKEFVHSNTTPSKKKKEKMSLNTYSQDGEPKELDMESEISQISPSQNESLGEIIDKPLDDFKKKERKKWKKSKHVNDMESSSAENSPSKMHEKKKERQLQRLRKKREKQGILLLPPKVEQKLYKIKKTLREKGIPPEIQKQIIRKERRKAELEYRKVINPSKLCFHCREPGHLFADCPKKSDSMKQETGICFKCGSPEHVSFKCPEKIKGFPLAKCFICKEQGHISRDCPRNKHGVYPKGGRCNICGNVNHLKKDCPSLMKQKEVEESEVTLHTINEDTSIDAEIVPKGDFQKKCSKKPKIVKF